MNCPNEHGEMNKIRRIEETTFRGLAVRYEVESWTCADCGIEVDDLHLAAANQRALSEAYRKAAGLLTGKEIVDSRKRLGWSQEELANNINVGVVSVKRWERGQIQTPVMDQALRGALLGKRVDCDPYSGNRPLSLERVKLVLVCLGKQLGRDLLKGTGNRLLYPAKYLWYADMLCFRETGQSMTGATYAVLPQGPQLNNYRDLVELIKEADESGAEELTDHEMRILSRIAARFPSDKSVYDASHTEEAWKSIPTGRIIPYTEAARITSF